MSETERTHRRTMHCARPPSQQAMRKFSCHRATTGRSSMSRRNRECGSRCRLRRVILVLMTAG